MSVVSTVIESFPRSRLTLFCTSYAQSLANFAPVHAEKSTSPEGTGIGHRVTNLVLFIPVRTSVRVLLSCLGSSVFRIL